MSQFLINFGKKLKFRMVFNEYLRKRIFLEAILDFKTGFGFMNR
jgi:hypothetical protein